MATNPRPAVKVLQWLAAAAFGAVAILALAGANALIPLHPETLCIYNNGCILYEDNRISALIIWLSALGVAFGSFFGAKYSLQGSRLAFVAGLLVLMLVGGAIRFLFVLGEGMSR